MTTWDTDGIKRCVLYGQLLILYLAFSSLYPQIHGLFGERGLVPVSPMLECDEESIWDCRLPLLRILCNVLQLSPAVGIQALCLFGLFLTTIAITYRSFQKLPTFLILYFCYRTIYEAGGVFMHYQWDAFLLESTVAVALLAWFCDGPPDSIALYGIVLVFLRAIFMNGVTKLQSKCPAYWSLTALDYYFESQPLPTVFAWHAHQLPPYIKQVASLVMHYCEIILPAFFLIPLKHVRYVAFFGQVLLMSANILTGNGGYLYYNILVLLISLLGSPNLNISIAPFLSGLVFGKMIYDVLHGSPIEIIIGESKHIVLTITQNVFQKFVAWSVEIMTVLMFFMLSLIGVTAVKMTGIYGRPEIVIEGATNIEGPWKEISFSSKPGNVSRRPDYPRPGYHRLDMQMHYAAEGTYQQNPFFLSLIYHLMQNNSEVVGLLDHHPFQNRSEPMNFARAKLYMYHFTKEGETDWWRRDFQEEYMPTFNKGNAALRNFLIENRILNKGKSKFTNGPLGNCLRRWHRNTGGIDAIIFTLVLASTTAASLLSGWVDRHVLRVHQRVNQAVEEVAEPAAPIEQPAAGAGENAQAGAREILLD
ncbi:hypothetical protein CAEBREN_01125 [Caenorhabditis brenneri]|uniref:Lipase maturation factor n=1 Tax=Caenorhabditis brenneri TaxID=135651 RepID=G0MSI2_CAEBE|nr:hypothetical protein CAEBREN_01125 [Caenorhabditis brenneri]